MKNAIIEMKGSLHDRNIQHAVVDLSDLAGYDLPWLNDDISLDYDGKGTVMMKVYSGYKEDALTRGAVEAIAERWGLGFNNISIRWEGEEDDA